MSAAPGSDHTKRSIVVGVILSVITAVALLLPEGDDDAFEQEAAVEVAALPPLSPTEIHEALDYGLDRVARQKLAPRIFLSGLDFDLGRIRDVNEKKATFFRIMLPIVARENDRIRAERQKIVDDPAEAPATLYDKYDVPPGDVDELLRRVDVVPASLVLAQAALESGWGSSRFARKGNNFFGMRTYDQDAPGIAPKNATGFKVMIFRDISHGVRAYMRNLNTHSAYKSLRQARAEMRHSGSNPDGSGLTNYLTAYSEIPEEYGGRLRSMIRRNKLARFDGVRLEEN